MSLAVFAHLLQLSPLAADPHSMLEVGAPLKAFVRWEAVVRAQKCLRAGAGELCLLALALPAQWQSSVSSFGMLLACLSCHTCACFAGLKALLVLTCPRHKRQGCLFAK